MKTLWSDLPVEETMARLWQAVIQNGSPPPLAQPKSISWRGFHPRGLDWWKGALGEGVLFWLTRDPRFVAGGPPSEPLAFSGAGLVRLDWLARQIDPTLGPTPPKWAVMDPQPADPIIDWMIGRWIASHAPRWLLPYARQLPDFSRYILGLWLLQPKIAHIPPIDPPTGLGESSLSGSHRECLILCQYQLAQAWEAGWDGWSNALGRLRTADDLNAWAQLASGMVGILQWSLDEEALHFLAGRLIRLATGHLATMSTWDRPGFAPFSTELDWGTMPLAERNLARRQAHISLAMGARLADWRARWRKTPYVDDAYESAQSRLALLEKHGQPGWLEGQLSLTRAWSNEWTESASTGGDAV